MSRYPSADESNSCGCCHCCAIALLLPLAYFLLVVAAASVADWSDTTTAWVLLAGAGLAVTLFAANSIRRRRKRQRENTWQQADAARGEADIEIELLDAGRQTQRADAWSHAGKCCPFCRSSMQAADSVVSCPSCSTPHHEECWRENGGCTRYGCPSSPAMQR